jgi:hypothetical protein
MKTMKNYRTYLHTAALSVCCLTALALTSCKGLLDAKEAEVLTEDEFNQTTYDADVAVLGVYSKFMGLAERVVVLNELRADMMDVTANSTADMTALNNHTEDATNTYCDPTPFYEVILNCNSALASFDKMKTNNILNEVNYRERYGDVMAIRCWTYLQLGIHFGTVPYVTAPIDTKADAIDSLHFPKKTLDQLLPLLISDMNSLANLNDYSDVQLPNYIKLGYSVQLGFVNKRILLGDLYLWNNDYVNAAQQYYNFLATANESRNQYKTTSGTWQTGSVPVGFWISFLRYNSGNVNAYGNMWKRMFSLTSTDAELQYEMIWEMTYDYRYAPTYPFVKLFANTGQGAYMLKPSAYAIDSLWENQVQRDNGFAYDGRGREASFDWVNGDPVVIKYLYDYYTQTLDNNGTIHLAYNTVSDAFKQQGRWFLYRSAMVQLRYAEAVNRAGYPKLAMALVNRGIRAAFPSGYPSESSYNAVTQTTTYYPYPAPYFLDGSSTTTYTGPWYNNVGIRGRANLNGYSRPSWATAHINDTILRRDTTAYKTTIHNDSILWAEECILQESGLELGFEGHRWDDLLRITRRRMEIAPGNRSDLLNRQVASKFALKGQAAPDLSVPAHWYLPMRP